MDDTRPSTGFAGLSRQYAERGDLRRAALAAWAADVHVLEELLWANGLDQAPEPLQQLAAIGESIAETVEGLATQPRGPLTLRAVVEAARQAMVTTFDESVHGLLTERLADLAHLDEVPAVAAADADDSGAAVQPAGVRLGGRSADELVHELRVAAADCSAMATHLAAEGERDAAARLGDQADAASFEAYLVQAAVSGGDHDLATVDLRWDLAAERSGRTGLVRDDLVAVLGTGEQQQLRTGTEPVR